MKVGCEQLFTGATPQSWASRTIQFPIVRMLIAILFLAPILALDKLFKKLIIAPLSGDTQIVFKYLEAAIFFVLLLFAYRLYTKFVEKRKALELSAVDWFRESGMGFLVSMSLVVIIVLILYSFGYFEFIGFNPNKRVALDFVVRFAMGAFIEELFFRLIVFRLTEELLGSWIALIIQVVFFGFAHQANENATFVTSLSLIAVGGIFYTAAFMYTRRIWLPLGIHMGWNYCQSGIFSMPNSGTQYEGLIIAKVQGPQAITGGSFGIEASFIAILLCLIVGIVLIMMAFKGGQFTPPIWKRGNRISGSLPVNS